MGVLKSIAAKLIANKMKSKLEKEGFNLDEIVKSTKSLKASNKQLNSELDIYCKLNPNSPICKNRNSKPRWKKK